MSFLDPRLLAQFDDSLGKHLESLSSGSHMLHLLTNQSLESKRDP